MLTLRTLAPGLYKVDVLAWRTYTDRLLRRDPQEVREYVCRLQGVLGGALCAHRVLESATAHHPPLGVQWVHIGPVGPHQRIWNTFYPLRLPGAHAECTPYDVCRYMIGAPWPQTAVHVGLWD
jgi:hypothetical protein